MTQQITHCAGIDISKDHLDVHVTPGEHVRQFTNSTTGWRALAKWITGFAPERIVYESTGPYHRGMERALASQSLPIVRVNARRARRFAEALGTTAKTDRVDARMLARFAATLMPDVTALNPQAIEELREIEAARRALIKARTAIKNRSRTFELEVLGRQSDASLALIEVQIAELDHAALALIKQHEKLHRRHEIFCSIPGVGPTTATTLQVLMPELGTMDEKQVASLAGLAPVARDSGNWRGKRFCQGGRARLREALYMPALVAMRFNPDLKTKYDDLVARGKPAKVAITAIMRKLIILANALVRDGRKWTPSPA